MLKLDSTLKSLEVKLALAKATTELPFIAGYVDINQSSFALSTAAENDGTTNGVTAVTVVAAPAATTTRKLDHFSLVNVDTAVATVTVQINNNGTVRISFKATLQIGDQIAFTDASGWIVYDANGNQKTMIGGVLPAANFPALTGDVTTAAGSLATAIGAGKVTNAMLAGSITAANLVKTDITSLINLAGVGTITSGVWNAGPVTSSGLLTINGFGTHIHGAGGTGGNIVQVRNTTAGTGNYSAVQIGTDISATDFSFGSFSSIWTTSGINFQSGSVVATTTAGGLSVAATHASGAIRLYAGGTTRRGLIDTDGTWTMDVYGAGTATFSAAGKLSSVSDERLKNITGPLEYGLTEVLALHPVRYTWNNLSGLDDPKHTEYGGFTAQDVQRVMPLAIGINPQGYLSFADRPVIAALVNAVKELNARLLSFEGKQ